ncbi:MAG: cytidylate kinase-like family protein [Proteobacteria bacterium]|nr:cytidylate kinase-like family protein [Pseudomonadota bacterium]
MAVISISRQFGAGGKTLGERLAARLGYQLLDRNLMTRVAKEANVSLDWVVAVERETGGRLMKYLSKMVSGDFIERHLADSAVDFDEKKYVTFIKKVILDVAEDGDAIILGRGSQFILPNKPGIFKILLVGEYEDRVRFLMDQYHINRKQSEQLVGREEKKREVFLNRLGRGEQDNPNLYHLCLNTSLISLECAEKLVFDMVKSEGATKQ